MCLMSRPHQFKAAATYDAASDHFDAEPLGFWERHGRRLVAALALQLGERVLDVGCGTGATALPAAIDVGPQGSVLGIDIAEKMLLCGRQKAVARGLENIRFELRDMMESGLPEAHFDAVVASFAIFFVPDIESQLRELWRMVRPGGRLGITTWGENAFQPVAAVFGEEIRKVKTDLPVAIRPWERLTKKAAIQHLFIDSGTTEPAIQLIDDQQPLAQIEDCWTIVMGSGYRWEVDQLTADQQAETKAKTLARLAAMNVTAVDFGALHVVARKPV